MGEETILTRGITKEQQWQRDCEANDWKRYQILLDLICEGYLADEMKFDRACVLAVDMVKDFEGEGFQILPERGRSRLLGDFLIKLVAEKRPLIKSTRLPGSIKKITAELVKIAKSRDGHLLTREGSALKKSAYDVIAARMCKYGIDITPRVVESYYQEYK